MKIANLNGCNILINNLHKMKIPKKLKIEFNKGLQSFWWSKKSITSDKLKQFVTCGSLIKMELFNAFYVYVNVEY